jgi:hypothetical protein
MVAAATAVLLAAPAYAGGSVNLVTNGDFETVNGGDGTQISPSLGTQNVAGWAIGARATNPSTPGLGFIFTSGNGDNPAASSSGVFVYGPQSGTVTYATSTGTYTGPDNNGLTANSGATTTGGTNGGNYLALDADPQVSGALSQTINGLTVGYGYVLQFYWATAELSNQTLTQTTEYIQATLGGQTQSTQTLTTAAAGFDPWRQVTLYFTATSTSEVLSLLAIGAPAGDPPAVLLDAVSLSYVPEPSTWAMMLVGVGGLAGFAAMRRRSRALPATTA